MTIIKSFELTWSSCAFVVKLLHQLCDTVVRIFRLLFMIMISEPPTAIGYKLEMIMFSFRGNAPGG